MPQGASQYLRRASVKMPAVSVTVFGASAKLSGVSVSLPGVSINHTGDDWTATGVRWKRFLHARVTASGRETASQGGVFARKWGATQWSATR